MVAADPVTFRRYHATDYSSVASLWTRINRELAPVGMERLFEQYIAMTIDGELKQLLEVFSAAKRSERFLKMKTGQAAAGLLGGHFLGNFRSYWPKSALSIESIGGFLNLSRAYNHPCESERTRFCLRTFEHALRDT